MNNRRRLVTALGACALTAPFASFAQQQGKVWRIGFLSAEGASTDMVRAEGLRAGLRERGYVEGVHYLMVFRWGEGNYERLEDLAGELVRLPVDVLVTVGTKAVASAKRATTTIPIVMALSGDILALGLVTSLARPGGNITGSVNIGRELGPKRLQLLKEFVPRIARVAYFGNPRNPAFEPNLQAMFMSAKSLKVELQPFELVNPDRLEATFSDMAKRRIDALVLQDETSFTAHSTRITGLALKYRLPTGGNPRLAENGALLGYGPDIDVLDRRTALFIEKILKGTKPGDIPIEQPTRFDLLVNMKTARALGIKMPQSILVRSHKVIE